MTLTFAHIVNPVTVGPSSDLFVAQPITFESMRRARAKADPLLQVTLYSAQYNEDRSSVPGDYQTTPDLTRSILDYGDFSIPRKLPLLRHILDRLYAASTADYLIYTNVDIGLQPQFYTAVYDHILSGYDSFVINRRTLPANYSTVADLEAIYAQSGTPHSGWDCFVFPRSIYLDFKLHNVCLGASRVGLALLANLVAFSDNFKEFQNDYLTFHIGNERRWRRREYADYDAHNTRQMGRIMAELEMEVGPFEPQSIPGAFLTRRRTFGPLYDTWSRYVSLPTGVSQILNRLSGRKR